MEQITEITTRSLELLNRGCIVLDTETTGFSRQNDRIIELGAIKMEKGGVVDVLNVMINPEKEIHPRASAVNGITNEMLWDKPTEREYMEMIVGFFQGGYILVGHNAKFDLDFLKAMFERNGYNFNCMYMDTMQLAKKYYPELGQYKLESLARELGIEARGYHRAIYDAEVTVKLLRRIAQRGKGG